MTQELERGDSGLRSFVSVQGALVMYPIYSYGSDAQKNRWLPLLQAGQSHRMLWLDRTAVWIESGRNADARGEEGQQVHLERRKDVDYERVDRGRGGGVGQDEDDKVRGFLVEKGAPRIQGLGRAREVVTAGFGDVRIILHRLRNSGRKSAARRFPCLKGPPELA